MLTFERQLPLGEPPPAQDGQVLGPEARELVEELRHALPLLSRYWREPVDGLEAPMQLADTRYPIAPEGDPTP